MPLVLPPVVGGVALFAALGRKGLVGRPLDEAFGITLPFTTAAVVVAEAFVAMPFLVIAVEGALRGSDRRYDEAAATLGASRWYTFRRVTLPLVAPGVAAGSVLCWARALGEFGATITFAGNFPGTTRTMPVEVYLDPAAGSRRRRGAVAGAAPRVGRRAGRAAGPMADQHHRVSHVALEAELRVRRGTFDLDLAITVQSGEVVALLGPNGAGKSTALRLLAGLLAVDDGLVRLGGRVVEDTVARVRVPPEQREVGVVFQDYLLFPHLSARENVAFGLRARGVPRAEARARADAWLDRVGLAGYAGQRPRRLSGGQGQRVALARALAADPRLLLLDEPLAALDAGTRLEVRADLRRHLAGYDGAAVVVTHDALDAMVLADRLVVLENGRVVQAGTPREIAAHPRTDYVARLVGLNLLRGRAVDGRVDLPGGSTLTSAGHADGDVFVSFPPTAVALHRRQPEGSARNCWPGRVTSVEVHGDTVRVALVGPVPVVADVTPLAVADLGLRPDTEVWATVKATETTVYPA